MCVDDNAGEREPHRGHECERAVRGRRLCQPHRRSKKQPRQGGCQDERGRLAEGLPRETAHEQHNEGPPYVSCPATAPRTKGHRNQADEKYRADSRFDSRAKGLEVRRFDTSRCVRWRREPRLEASDAAADEGHQADAVSPQLHSVANVQSRQRSQRVLPWRGGGPPPPGEWRHEHERGAYPTQQERAQRALTDGSGEKDQHQRSPRCSCAGRHDHRSENDEATRAGPAEAQGNHEYGHRRSEGAGCRSTCQQSRGARPLTKSERHDAIDECDEGVPERERHEELDEQAPATDASSDCQEDCERADRIEGRPDSVASNHYGEHDDPAGERDAKPPWQPPASLRREQDERETACGVERDCLGQQVVACKRARGRETRASDRQQPDEQKEPTPLSVWPGQTRGGDSLSAGRNQALRHLVLVTPNAPPHSTTVRPATEYVAILRIGGTLVPSAETMAELPTAPTVVMSSLLRR